MVERDLGRGGEGLPVEMENRAAFGRLAGGDGGMRRRGDLRRVGVELGQRHGGAQQEDAAVPQIAIGDVLAGMLGVGLLDKARDGAGAGLDQFRARLDVAVAGGRPCRRDAEDDDLARLRRRKGRAHRAVKAGRIADDVIGGENQEGGLGVGAGDEGGGGGDCRGGVAPFRLEQRDGGRAGLGQRRADEMGMVGAGDHNRGAEQGRRGDALQGEGEGGGAIDQRQERLGVVAARGRPQARTGAAAHNDRDDHGFRPFTGQRRKVDP